MWMLVFLFFFQTGSNPCQASPGQTPPPSLIVQVVDSGWLPIAGAEVTIKPLREDARTTSDGKKTGKDGYAKFFAPGDADYSVEVEMYGFKRERLNHVHLVKRSGSSSAAYVQLKMSLSGPGTTVY
jgi:hypothetical protein